MVTGQATLIHFLVSNPFPQDDVFQLVISGDEAAPRNELHLVHNEGTREWQFWHGEGKCARPPSGWDSVSSKGDVLLKSGQQCPLVFKFLTFREGVSDSNMDQQENGNFLRPKKIKVTLVSRDSMPVQTLEIRIRPKEQYCDQVFRFYEPQSTKCYVRLPKGFAPFFALAKGMTVRTSAEGSI